MSLTTKHAKLINEYCIKNNIYFIAGRKTLAKYGFDNININNCTTTDEFLSLDNISQRWSLALKNGFNTNLILTLCNHKDQLNAIFNDNTIGTKTNKNLETIIDKDLMPYIELNNDIHNLVNSIDPDKLWKDIANLIAIKIYEFLKTSLHFSQWELHSRLLLVAFFQASRVPEAKHISYALKKIYTKKHGIRGEYLRINEKYAKTGISDVNKLPNIQKYFSRKHKPVLQTKIMSSQFIDEILNESANLALNKGLLHRRLNLNAPLATGMNNPVNISLTLARDNAYKEREHALQSACYMAGIEHAIRSWAKYENISQFKADNIPLPLMKFAKNISGISKPLLNMLDELYDSNKSNIRNKIMHGAYLDCNVLGTETLINSHAIPNYNKNLSLDDSPYLPSSVSNILNEIFINTVTEAGQIGISNVHTNWIDRIWLTSEEIKWGHSIPCDFYGSNYIRWMMFISSFSEKNFPAISTYVKTLIVCWIENEKNALSLICMWSIVFEPLVRMCLMVTGETIMRASPFQNDKYRCEYLILDENSLLKNGIIHKIVSCLPEQERPIAEKTFTLAIKIRNALAHGAIPYINEYIYLGVGHIVIKTIQLLYEYVNHHMTRENAYYNWLNRGKNNHNMALDDWLNAETTQFNEYQDNAYSI